MSTRENESVASRPFWIARIVTQVTRPEGVSHRRSSHWKPRMTGVGLLHGIRREKTESINCTKLKFIWHKNLPKRDTPFYHRRIGDIIANIL